MRNLITLLLSITCFVSFSQNAIVENDYYEGQIIVKIKTNKKDKCNKSNIQIPSIQKLIKEENIVNTIKIFPNHPSPKNKSNHPQLVDLSTIYKFEFDKSINEKKLLNQLRQNENVEYAELNYINRLAYTPTDSVGVTNQQWYLSAIKVFDAWDIQQGDTNVVIGITDTGTDVDHEDLITEYAYNHDDSINGIDDDNDGFIDNYLGWDVATNDNDVQLTTSGHGTNVAGLASAATDNGKGMSGTGFNTRILPIK